MADNKIEIEERYSGGICKTYANGVLIKIASADSIIVRHLELSKKQAEKLYGKLSP